MTAPLEPSTLEELAAAVLSAPRVVARGAGTKPGLSAASGAVVISTARLAGIVDYAPTEFTFTARAGTPLGEITAVLAAQGQCLPFDPPLIAAGATLGGTVAAGFNGPGRLRFGGVRDFILGVRFVDGEGRVLRMGGRVVKNAAGFDLPKFFVGSLGRFGILAEITFKVFPRPASEVTVEFPAGDSATLVPLLRDLAKGRWEFDAVEAPVSGGRVYARLRAPAEALGSLVGDLGRVGPVRALSPGEADALWQGVNGFAWAHAEGLLCKVPLVLGRVTEFIGLVRELPGARGWVGAAGGVGFVSLPEELPGGTDGTVMGVAAGELDRRLRERGLSGLAWRGCPGVWLGKRAAFSVHAAVKHALDPLNRFPAID